jgi:hypothetical protein
VAVTASGPGLSVTADTGDGRVSDDTSGDCTALAGPGPGSPDSSLPVSARTTAHESSPAEPGLPPPPPPVPPVAGDSDSALRGRRWWGCGLPPGPLPPLGPAGGGGLRAARAGGGGCGGDLAATAMIVSVATASALTASAMAISGMATPADAAATWRQPCQRRPRQYWQCQ